MRTAKKAFRTPGNPAPWILHSVVLVSLLVVGSPAAQGQAAEFFEIEPEVDVFLSRDGAFLGVQVEEETDYDEGGARVSRVVDGSPAADAGLQSGDIIVAVDGHTVRGPRALTEQIRRREPGDSVTLTLVRDGREETLVVELGERSWEGSGLPGNFEFLERFGDEEFMERFGERMEGLGEHFEQLLDCDGEDCEFPFRSFGRICDDEDCEDFRFIWSGRPVLGVQLVDTTPELRKHLGSPPGVGILIAKVIDGTPAETAGIRVGDLIVAIDGEEISGAADLRRALRDKPGSTFVVDVIRDRQALSLSVRIPEEKDREVPRGAAPALQRS